MQIHRLTKVWVIFMLSGLIKAFAMSGAPKDAEWYPRTVHFSSGAALEFHMPENFSKDMPAEDLIDHVDLNQLEASDPAGKVLMRRWWDFKTDSFFSRDIGSLMMSLRVNASERNLFEGEEFAIELRERMLQLHSEHNDQVPHDEFSDFGIIIPYIQHFLFAELKSLVWIRYPLSQGKRFEENYSIQLDANHYVTVTFEALPSDDVELVPFKSKYADPLAEKILSLIRLDHSTQIFAQNALKVNSQLKEKLRDDLKVLDRQLDQKYLAAPTTLHE